MFGKDKKAFLFTHLIVKVRKYGDDQPYFSLYNTPAIADETKARDAVKKLNELAQLNVESGVQEEYYSVPLTL